MGNDLGRRSNTGVSFVVDRIEARVDHAARDRDESITRDRVFRQLEHELVLAPVGDAVPERGRDTDDRTVDRDARTRR